MRSAASMGHWIRILVIAASACATSSATGPLVRWFGTGEVLSQQVQRDFAMGNLSDGVIVCCHQISIDATGNLDTSNPLWSKATVQAISTIRQTGRTVTVDVHGDAAACASTGDCKMWQNREKLSQDVVAFAREYGISSITLDWEFADSFDWISFNRTWAFIARNLKSDGVTVEVCVNSVVENKGWVGGSDPSGNPFFRDYNWANKLTDMGTYELCKGNNCTEQERQFNLTKNKQLYDTPKSFNISGWTGGLEGRITNLLTLAKDRPSQLSPGLWFGDDCASTGHGNETTTHGWTATSLRAFLAEIYAQGVRSVDIWCGVGVGLPLPCPTCPWVADELHRWRGYELM